MEVHADQAIGVAFLENTLFSSYVTNLPVDEDNEPKSISFQIALSSFLEVLQIFGAVDIATKAQRADQDPYRSNIRNYRPDAFSNQTLGISGTCTLLYSEDGDPFKVTIEESGIKTTAALTTYQPEIPDDIPFDRDEIIFSYIMQSRHLLDSIAEISPTAPNRLILTATRAAPYLNIAGIGDLGKSAVDFARGRELFEKFKIEERWAQSFKFDFVKNSSEAMRIANKVCIRGDGQGVLSFQFMVDTDGPKPSYLDFRFVPYMHQNEGGDDDDDDDDGDQ